MDTGKLTDRIGAFFAKDLKLKLIVGLGILGMLLILLSHFLGSGGTEPENPPDELTASFTTESYAKSLEEKLQSLISRIDGVGRSEVMVTLESGVEYVYAQEEKRNTDRAQESGEEDTQTTHLTENIEQKYILVDSEYGKKEALVLTEIQPRIQGVVIVCEGADDVRVQQKLTSVVTTALGISSTRVCVVKIDPSVISFD